MADMLGLFVKQELDKEISENYPHLRHPTCVYASVSNVTVENDMNVCTLKILDKNMNADNDYPEIPSVKTSVNLSVGDIAVVILLYGECYPWILGRYVE